MAHDEGEACMYVKQSVLRELEQDRRRLKWQLSRALQTSDTHAAELEASKAKVKDLLTIVELNKGVADQAVQRSHGRDVQRRAELESLHQQNKQQHQRYVDFAVCLMSRRVRYRQQRDAFYSLQHGVQLRTRRQEALRRLNMRVRRRLLRWSLHRWKQLDATAKDVEELGTSRPLEAKAATILSSRFTASGALRVCSLEITGTDATAATGFLASHPCEEQTETSAVWTDTFPTAMC
ncbi:hypothetical protein Pcac1_g24290 [Phytophthora cactorum]|nr:hypothetical protein Pcac1_g24290 [Phytophthora cactorum]KAG2916444.1 hypothetical protein PC114_g7503 [Phytophthora cactorum]KAG3158659.1 hypothetical protein C6341_g14343 [Phytophthora cactorum]